MPEDPGVLGIGIDEDTAVILEFRMPRIMGSGAVYVADVLRTESTVEAPIVLVGFGSAQSMVNSAPTQVTTDGHDSYPRAIRETLGPKVKHRCSAYANRRIERDHRGIKQRYYPMLGFGALPSAQRFCRAFEEVRQYFRPRRKTERSDFTLQSQTTVSLQSTRTRVAVPASITDHKHKTR